MQLNNGMQSSLTLGYNVPSPVYHKLTEEKKLNKVTKNIASRPSGIDRCNPEAKTSLGGGNFRAKGEGGGYIDGFFFFQLKGLYNFGG